MRRKSTSTRSQRARNRKRIVLEQLERRELLAGDLLQNPVDPLDVNDDAVVSPIDALELINAINRPEAEANGGGEGERGGRRGRFMDVNGDGQLTPLDPLQVINGMRERRERGERGPRPDRPDNPPGEGPGEGADGEEFATIDGTNNNLANPSLGSTDELFERWFSSDYEDGIGEASGAELPSARDISNVVNASPGDIENAAGLSDLTWLFGQFIDHDITLSAEGHDEALNIDVSAGDLWFDPLATGEAEIDFTRSGYELDEDGVRQQVNLISAFIDGSVIYGSDQERADALRTFEGGQLATSDGDLLPFNQAGLVNAGGTSDSLFLAGDIRANENAALTAMHTVWVREHNRVAAKIAEDNPELSDEEIYQRARQFVTAELQAITYNEFLPALLGDNALSEYQGYDETVNPNISNAFATAAYRFGHTMLSSELLRLNQDGTVADEGNLPLQDAFFNTSALTENGIDSILLGAATQTAQEVDPFLVDDVRNFLFGPPGSGGFDLASLNIQRGRDHGLASYNQIREEMGLGAVNSFAEISSDVDVQARLQEAYGNVDAVDAWVGMLAEDHVDGSTLGVTAGTIIAEQFRVLRDGDRFYYENLFSGRELEKLESTTLADVIERNTGIDFARDANVFYSLESGQQIDDGRGRQRPDGQTRGELATLQSADAATQQQAADLAIVDLTDTEKRNRRSL